MNAQEYGSATARPYDGEKELERLAGLAELVEPFALSDELAIKPGRESAFVRTNLRQGREGLLLEWGASWAGAWRASPVFVVTLGLKRGAVQERPLGPFKAPVGGLAQPLSLGRGLLFKDSDVGIAVKNNGRGSRLAAGYVRGVTWSEKDQRRVRALLCTDGLVPPWPAGSVFGGP
jgi:hypothetical protein